MNKKILYILTVLIVLIAAFAIFNIRYNNKPTQPEQDKVEIDLYFSTQNAMYLVAEKRAVGSENLYENTLFQLIKGPSSSELGETIPDGVEVLDIKIEEGTAYLDFNRALVENHWGGSTGELLTVYSIVNTMTQFPEIERVMFLIEGENIETLAGHMDLSKPIDRNTDLLKDKLE